MNTSIQDSVVSQAEEEGYKLLGIEGDLLFFSLDGRESHSARIALEELDLEHTTPDLMALSTDFRYHGTIAIGWKSGSMMLMRLTGRGSSYNDLSASELEALKEGLHAIPLVQESAEVKAMIDEIDSGISSPASVKAFKDIAVTIEQELRDRHAHRLLDKLKPDATRQ